VTEGREVYETLDLALRIGEVLLSSGAGAADVTATMLAVTEACGVRHVAADGTFVDLTLHHQPTIDQVSALQMLMTGDPLAAQSFTVSAPSTWAKGSRSSRRSRS